MRRLLLICLIMLLPFQAVWSATAAVCMHEETEAVPHLGHHEAHHSESQRSPQAEGASAADGTVQSDHHHFLNVDLPPSMLVLLGPLIKVELIKPNRTDRYPTTSIAALERPPKDFCRTLSVRIV